MTKIYQKNAESLNLKIKFKYFVYYYSEQSFKQTKIYNWPHTVEADAGTVYASHNDEDPPHCFVRIQMQGRNL